MKILSYRLPLVLAAALLTGIVSASAFADDALTPQACSRLSGKDKATCEWNNHKLYEKMAKEQPQVQEAATSEPAVFDIVLPSCSRLSGKDKATCEWNNHKKMMEVLHPGSSSSS